MRLANSTGTGNPGSCIQCFKDYSAWNSARPAPRGPCEFRKWPPSPWISEKPHKMEARGSAHVYLAYYRSMPAGKASKRGMQTHLSILSCFTCCRRTPVVGPDELTGPLMRALPPIAKKRGCISSTLDMPDVTFMPLWRLSPR